MQSVHADTQVEWASLVEDNMALVPYVMNRINCKLKPSMGKEDLEQCGYIGLIQAAKKYEQDKGKFSTYAYPRIKGAMLDAIRDQRWLPRSARYAMRSASPEEDVSELENKDASDSLWMSIYGREKDGFSILHKERSKASLPDQVVEKRERNEVLREAISFLPENERRAIEGYFFENKSHLELSEELGCSDGRISQLKNRAFETLARYLRKKGYEL